MWNFDGEQLAVAILILLTICSLAQWQRIQVQYSRNGHVLPFAERPQIKWNVFLILTCGLLTAAQLFNRIQSDMLQQENETSVELVRTAILISAGLIGLLLLMLSELGTVSLKQFGISFENWKHNTLLGFRGFLAAILPVVLARMATLPLSDGQPEHALLKLLGSDQATETIALITFSAVVLAPLSEELLFRVILQGYLQQRFSPRSAILLIAILFAAVHPFPMSLALLPLALILGYIYYRSHSYLAVVITHALFNGTNVLLSLLTLHAS